MNVLQHGNAGGLHWPAKILRVMRLTTILVLAATLHVSARGLSQKISLSEKQASLEKIFKDIQQQTGYSLIYNYTLLKNTKPVSIYIKDGSLEQVLQQCLQGQGLTYVIEQRFITIKAKADAALTYYTEAVALKDLAGKIKTEQGDPVQATVTIKGTSRSVMTNENGDFLLKDISGNETLVITGVNIEAFETRLSGQSSIALVAVSKVAQLKEIAIINTGYQTISKERATGAYSVVTASDISNKMQTNIMARLEGQVTGYSTFKDTSVRIRGSATIFGPKTPLYVVDGFPFEGNLQSLNPWDIESVTVLKDAIASSIYGARSANGVIVITTKKGKSGKTVVDYNGTVRLVHLQDSRAYLNLMNSRELVNFQQEMFNVYHTPFANVDPRGYLNEVKGLLYQREAGTITADQLNTRLDTYRNIDSRDQIIDNFLRHFSVTQQHNISFRGGSDKYVYAASANYTQTLPFENTQKDERIGYNIRTSYNVAPWLRTDVGLIGSYTNSSVLPASTGSNYLPPFSPLNALNYAGSRPSYIGLYDENGILTSWANKSQQEINRLIQAGLNDESYNPVTDKGKTYYKSTSAYTNINLGLNIKLAEGLSFAATYQTEKTFSNGGYFLSKDSYSQRATINNAAKIDPVTGKITYLIPTGGARNDTRTEANSYTLRGQFNYTKNFHSKHTITAIAGGERRKINTKTFYKETWGYDDISLASKTIDETLLSTTQSGTQALNSSYTYGVPTPYRETENRFVSFYANASYEYNRKYTFSSSIRMDQSNLFGTDPSLQYRPLWSVGGKWNIAGEDFMHAVNWINSLALRATYGINGNVPTQSGPYLIAANAGVNTFNNEYSSRISSPPNSRLRWEKTRQADIGVDFSLFRDRLSGTIDYYSKNTGDLLGSIPTDPTFGWNSLLLNYASMYNRGYEVSLTSLNIKKGAFRWQTTLNFSYNKNQVTDLQNTANAVSNYFSTAAYTNPRVGRPLGALYSVRWAGLDNLGRPQAYKADGKTIVKSLADLTVSDLVYSGTVMPPYSGSLTNTFVYKGWSLSCMLVYYAGGKMRDAMPAYITNPDAYVNNTNRNITNYWKTPGDENDPNKSPAVYRNASTNVTYLWYAADKHILKTDFIKLRDLTLGYELSGQWMKKVGFTRLRVQTQIQNLWYKAANSKGLDPEAWAGDSFASAVSRIAQPPVSYTFGISASF